MTELPENWKMKRLGDCLEKLKSGKKAERGWSPQCLNHPVKDPSSWGVLKTTSVQMGEYQPEYNKELPKTLEPKESLEVNPGDFLLTTTGPRNRCGVICYVKTTPKKLIFSGKILRFRADESEISSKWLLFLLMSPEYHKMLDVLKVGTSDSSVSIGNQQVLDLHIPVPPIAVQNEIVEILEDHLSRLDAAIVDVKSAKRKLAQLQKAIYHQEFPSDGVEKVPLGNLLSEKLRNGNSSKETTGKGGVRTLTLTAITRDIFDDSFTKLTTADITKVSDLWLKADDILIQRSNTSELVGSSAIYKGEENWAIYPDLLIRVRVDRKKIAPNYLANYLRSQTARKYFQLNAKGISGSMPKIDQQTIEELQIPLPALEVQESIVSRIESLVTIIKKQEEIIAFVEKSVNSLRRSILQAAFTGQLTKEVANV